MNHEGGWVFGQDNLQEAMDSARAYCEQHSGGACIPVALNDRQLYDPIPKARQQQQEQQNMINTYSQMLQMMGTMHR